MNVIFIASIVFALTLIFGISLAAITGWFGRLVVREQTAALEEREHYNQNLTLGLEIPFDTDQEEQMKAARKLAAKKAASLPRGSNMHIGKMGASDQPTAYDGVKADPVSAVKIAEFHSWEGVRSGIVISGDSAAAVRAPAQSTAPVKSADELVPGVDYPFIEISDDLSPAEKRKARIANAKARSKAVKTLKESGQPAGVPLPASESAVPSEPSAATPGTALAAEPVAGVDYPVIEITDDMDPAKARSARIANSKARSAAMKAYKQGGGGSTPGAPQVSEPAQEASIEAEMDDGPGISSVPVDIPEPNYIEITDDMNPDEVRRARIQNSKDKSAYNRALKAAGIDPSSL